MHAERLVWMVQGACTRPKVLTAVGVTRRISFSEGEETEVRRTMWWWRECVVGAQTPLCTVALAVTHP